MSVYIRVFGPNMSLIMRKFVMCEINEKKKIAGPFDMMTFQGARRNDDQTFWFPLVS